MSWIEEKRRITSTLTLYESAAGLYYSWIRIDTMKNISRIRDSFRDLDDQP